MSADFWGYDGAKLRASLSENTIAVIAVNFLGAGDDVRLVQEQIRGLSIQLIQDCAQHIPEDDKDLLGDYIVLSFGRGKPINLLGGGALLTRDVQPLLGLRSRLLPAEQSLSNRLLRSRTAALLFNAATHPWLYGVLNALPGLGVGTTRFKSLEQMRAMSEDFFRLLGPAITAYQADQGSVVHLWQQVVPEWQRWGVRLLRSRGSAPARRMLRLPLVAQSRDHRDALVAGLIARGLGATKMYGCSVDRVPGVPEEVAIQGPFPAAGSLADRLFTLPTHRFVTCAVVEAAQRCIEHCAAPDRT